MKTTTDPQDLSVFKKNLSFAFERMIIILRHGNNGLPFVKDYGLINRVNKSLLDDLKFGSSFLLNPELSKFFLLASSNPIIFKTFNFILQDSYVEQIELKSLYLLYAFICLRNRFEAFMILKENEIVPYLIPLIYWTKNFECVGLTKFFRDIFSKLIKFLSENDLGLSFLLDAKYGGEHFDLIMKEARRRKKIINKGWLSCAYSEGLGHCKAEVIKFIRDEKKLGRETCILQASLIYEKVKSSKNNYKNLDENFIHKMFFVQTELEILGCYIDQRERVTLVPAGCVVLVPCL